MKDRQRIQIVQSVLSGRVTVEEAGRLLGRSERTVFRLMSRLSTKGVEGLVHGNRGRPSSRRTADSVEQGVITLVKEKYRDVNDTHLAELLAEREKIKIGRETLRRLLRRNGVEPKRSRRSRKYRSRRERKPAFGMMLQVDASPHDWLEGRGPYMTLVGGIDDATNFRWARFVEAETTWSYLDLMESVITRHGIPQSLYSDRHSIFISQREPTVVEQLKGLEPETEFGRAMRELGVKIIPAYSPQAKGRVERMWGVLQDRLVVELRLAGAKNIAEANTVLERFLTDFNQRFRVEPKSTTNLFRKAPPLERLRRILCIKQTRVVQKDHTISFENLVLQIPPSRHFTSIADRRVDVLQLKDGSIEISFKGRSAARFSPEAVARMMRGRPHLKSDLRSACERPATPHRARGRRFDRAREKMSDRTSAGVGDAVAARRR